MFWKWHKFNTTYKKQLRRYLTRHRVGVAAVINRHFQDGETTCRQLSKILPDNSTIFAAEATAISLALNYYRLMGPVYHDVVVYSDSMSCLQAMRMKTTRTLLFVISWTCSGYWVTRADMSVSARYQATVALREMKKWTDLQKRPLIKT